MADIIDINDPKGTKGPAKGKGSRKPKGKRPPVFGTLKQGEVDIADEATSVPGINRISVHPNALKLGRPSLYEPDWMIPKVIEVGRNGGTFIQMATAIGVTCRETLYRWARENPDFNDALKKAAALSQSWWEEQGKIATFGGYENFNATSYIFQMKNRFPASWRDVKQNEVTGLDGGAIQIETKTIDARLLGPEQREALKQALLTIREQDEEGD